MSQRRQRVTTVGNTTHKTSKRGTDPSSDNRWEFRRRTTYETVLFKLWVQDESENSRSNGTGKPPVSGWDLGSTDDLLPSRLTKSDPVHTVTNCREDSRVSQFFVRPKGFVPSRYLGFRCLPESRLRNLEKKEKS